MSQLDQKIAVITGASSGIGHAIAKCFAKEGARVVINYCNSSQAANNLADKISADGGTATAIQADMADTEQIKNLISVVNSKWGKIDIWVNNAGADILTGDGARLSDQEKLQQLIDVDLKGTINACWAIEPVMKQQKNGVIINMSWDYALHGFQGINPQMFSAIKAGVLGFSRSFARTAGPEIRVNVLAPGWIQTAFANEVMAKDYFDARISEIPLGRFGTPEDVAATALFLASDASSYMTGEVIKINGGLI